MNSITSTTPGRSIRRRLAWIAAGLLLTAALLALACAEWLVPAPIQVFLAGTATCDISDEELGRGDPQFKGSHAWEWALARYYRFREWHAPRRAMLDLEGRPISTFHIFLAASEGLRGLCDAAILPLFRREISLGVPLDVYDARGMTPLHEAVLFQRPDMVAALIAGGADLRAPIRNRRPEIHDMTALQMATYFSTRPNGARWDAIRDQLAAARR